MRNLTKIWLVAAVLWLLYGLVWAEQLVNRDISGGSPTGWGEALQVSLIGLSLCWLPISVGMTMLVQRYPLERGRIGAGLIASVLAVAIAITGRALFVWVLDPWLAYWYEGQPPAFSEVLWHSARINLMLALTIVGLAHGWVYLHAVQAHRLRIAELEARVSQARLDALRAQINPHFLFNAFNSIAELIHQDRDAADRMLVALSRLLRRSLDLSSGNELRLGDEIELLHEYLSIEQIRLGERLRVTWSVEPDCLQVWIPTLVLQPLVENAIIHGLARRRQPGEISIDIHGRDGDLLISIGNDGADDDATPVAGSGTGVSNVRQRLQQLHGEAASIDLQALPDRRHQVRLRLPLRTSSPAAAVSA